jgi:hypothetical protein
MLGELRLIGVNHAFDRKTIEVIGGEPFGEFISLTQAEALIAAGEASWIWKDDDAIAEATRPKPLPPAEYKRPDIPVEQLSNIGEKLDNAIKRKAACPILPE